MSEEDLPPRVRIRDPFSGIEAAGYDASTRPESVVERMARAAFESEFGSKWPPADLGTEWGSRLQGSVTSLVTMMRAALAAIREPTDAMKKAGDDAMDWESSDTTGQYYANYADGDCAKSWAAMIDEALR